MLDLRAAHIAPPDKPGNRIGLEKNGIEVERFLIKQKRREFARELNSALAS